jgi:alpha-D-xyloside xylohydrolase
MNAHAACCLALRRFRLHGHRGDGVPANQCGGTNGDNEVWNLAKEPQHYAGITKVMHLRENLREYVAEINDEAAATGMPMLRPMFLQWPEDKGCTGTDVEDQFMFGPRWLVAPVTTYKATSRSVYLPKLADGQEWIYYYSMKAMGSGGSRVTMDTPIDEVRAPIYHCVSCAQPSI